MHYTGSKEQQKSSHIKHKGAALLLASMIAVSLLLSACSGGKPSADPGSNVNKSESMSDTANKKQADSQAITEESLSASGITSRGRWGNLVFDISYNIPYSDAPFSDAQAKIYPHGHSFMYYDNYRMYVEGLLDGEDYSLETLFEKICQQKSNAKYEEFYTYLNSIKTGTPEKTKQVKIGNIDAVYFEYKLPLEEGETKKDQVTVFGYSFVFNNQPLCVYSYYVEEIQNPFTRTAKTFEEVQQYAQYLIASIQPYNGEAFVELDKQGNFSKSFADIQWINDYDYDSFSAKRWPLDSDAQNIAFMAFNSWVGNGIYSGAGSGVSDFVYPYYRYSDGEESLRNEFLMKEDLTLEGIFDATINGASGFMIGTRHILDESDVTVYGIPMKRYVIGREFDKNGISGYTVVYTFILDEVPYIWKIELAADSEYVLKMSDDCKALYRQTTELVADTLIRTIRTSPNEVDLLEMISDNDWDPINNPFK